LTSLGKAGHNLVGHRGAEVDGEGEIDVDNAGGVTELLGAFQLKHVSFARWTFRRCRRSSPCSP
jgi:hypothetical protein